MTLPRKPQPQSLPAAQRARIERAIALAHKVGKDFPLPAHPKMGQKGFDTVQLVLVVVAIGLITAAVIAGKSYLEGLVDEGYRRGVVEGKAEVQAKWDAEKDAAAKLQKQRDADVLAALDEADEAIERAKKEAEKHKTNWQEARNEIRRSGQSLGSCEQPGTDPAPTAANGGVGGEPSAAGIRAPGVAPGARPSVRLHWAFVGLRDSAHLGLDGKPLFGAEAQYALAAERSGTASPYTLDDALDVDKRNAERWNACRRDLADAINKVSAAEAAWQRANGSQR